MLIEEITEQNYAEKIAEGEKRVDLKLKLWETQKSTKNPNWFMLLDPTIWAYRFLQDKENKPLRLRGFQDTVINDKNRFILVIAANQIGKTWSLGCVKALHHAIMVPNASVLIISKSEQQAIGILDEIKWMMKRANIQFRSIIDQVENRTELHITNTDKKGVSVIRCLPPTTSVLSYPATLIICDEAGFWTIDGYTSQKNYFYQVIETRTNETKNWTSVKIHDVNISKFFTMGQIVVISNPNGQRGLLWDLWTGDDRFNLYRYCWLANPKNSITEYMKAKERMPSDVFDSSYAAVFSSATGGFITLKEYNDAVKEYEMAIPTDKQLFLGADFAGEDTTTRDVDSTVMFGGVSDNDKAKIVYLLEFPLRSAKTQVVYPEIHRLVKTYSVGGFGYDKQGVGDSVKNDLQDQGILPEYMIQAFTYSLPDKSNIYYNMKHMFEQRRVQIPDEPKLKEQLLGLRFEKTDAGHIKVHHQREGIHDDYADALANCIWMIARFSAGIAVDSVEISNRNKGPDRKINKGPRKTVLCTVCGMNKYSYHPETGVCQDCDE